jgi:hypothetical protein
MPRAARLPSRVLDMTIDWNAVGAIGTFIGAVGTVFLFTVALGALWWDREARRRELREAQARKVSAWVGGHAVSAGSPVAIGVVTALLLNASDGPVYHVIVWLVISYGAGPRTGEEVGDREDWRPATLEVLPPGRSSAELPWFGGGMHTRAGVELAFTDSAGRHWIRRVGGRLEESQVPPVRRYSIVEPVEWGAPGPASSS